MTNLDFVREILSLVEELLSTQEIRVETIRDLHDNPLPDVKIVHIPTEETVICANYPTQIENKIAAMLELRLRLDRSHVF
ncbi:MAG: hypothetical protein AAGA60_20645 [Cyanobacteria bacterium P01_E01_bin.42]